MVCCRNGAQQSRTRTRGGRTAKSQKSDQSALSTQHAQQHLRPDVDRHGKAQSAILELSKMLRYQLYEELGSCVSVEREVEFLQNYVALMRLRLNKNVEVTTDFRLTPHKEMQVAPHIFISIVENAFKHGVSITAPSHVHLRLDCDGKRLNFDCRNSYFPQRTHENPDGGIGLRLVKSRLELSYPGTHTWEHGIDSSRKEYYSRITLDL